MQTAEQVERLEIVFLIGSKPEVHYRDMENNWISRSFGINNELEFETACRVCGLSTQQRIEARILAMKRGLIK